MERLFLGIFFLIQKFKVVSLAAFALLIALAGYFAYQIQLSEDVSKLLPEKNIPVNLIENLEAIDFADRLFFHLHLKDSNAYKPDALIEIATALTDSLAHKNQDSLIQSLFYTVEASSIENTYQLILKYLPFYLQEQDYPAIEEMIQSENLEKNFRKKYKTLFSPASMFMRKMITKDPVGISLEPLKRLQTFQFDTSFILYKNIVFTSDKKHLLFYLTPKYKSSDTKNNGRLIAFIDEQIDQIQLADRDVEIHYFGAPAVAYANSKQIKADIILTVLIASFAIVLLVALFYRRKRLYFIIFLPAALSVLFSLSILSFFKGEISAIALGMGSILVGISIDYVFHIFTHAQNGHGIRQLFKDISTPIFISALTTAAAFFGLLFISSGALRDMGLFAGISILFAAIFSLILIPLFLPNFREEKLKENKMKDWLMPLFHYPFHQDKVLIIILLLLTPILYHFSKQVRFEGDLNAINYMPKKLKIAESKLNDISSVSQRNVFLVSRASTLDSALLNAEQMNLALDEIQKSGIDLSVAKIQNFLPSEELQKVRLKRWNKFWNEDRKNQLKNNLSKIEQTYGFKQNTFTDFTKTLDEQFETMNEIDRALIQQDLLKEFIHKYKNGYSVLTQIKVSNSQREDLQQALQKTSFKDSVIDKQFLATGFLDALKADFKLLVTITMLLVFGIILLSFGRIELSIITFLPMSLSWIWTLGIMALLNIPFNIVNIIISTLIFGLGIDYSIFITNGLVKEYASGKKVLYSFKTSIFFSSLTTILGIGVLLFAQHPALKSMALVTVIGLLSVLLIAFTIQPWLFNWLINTKDKQRVLPMTLSDFIGSIFTFVIFLLGTFMSTIIGFVLIKLIPGKSENLRFIFHKTIQLSSKFIVYILVHIPKKIVGLDKDKFRKPAVIISNHQSHIDIVLLLMLHPKMILLTNDWVQKNPFYGALVRMAEFYPVLDRLEENLPLIEAKVKKGYSIMIFPEGSRSADSKIKRFHKGAFYLAEKLELDILPVLLHGVGDCITKGENFLKRGQIHVKILNRISPHDLNFGSGYVSRSKSFRQFYLKQFELLKQEVETPLYFRRKLINNYIYKGPVLEWYARIKTRFDNNYSLFNELIPKEAKIVDIGCGYGFMAYMLHFLSDKRTILGIDYDEEKIEVAQHIHAANYLAKDQVQFISGDAQSIDFGKADAFVLSDVLHYLPYNEQEKVLINCICNLEPNGQIIIREADSNHKKHQGTRFSEWQSTKLIGFNKTSTDDKALFFTSKERLVTFFNAQKCTLQVIDTTKLNSNLIYIARKA